MTFAGQGRLALRAARVSELGSTELSGSSMAGLVVGAIAGVVVVVVLSVYTRRRTERLNDEE